MGQISRLRRRPTKLKGLSDDLDEEFRTRSRQNNALRQSRLDSLSTTFYNEPTASVSGVMNNAQVMGGYLQSSGSTTNV